MRLLAYSRLVIVFLITGIVYSCQKELYFDQEPPTTQTKNHWEFEESTVQFSGRMDSTVFEALVNSETISLYGTSANNAGKFYLQINSAAKLKAGIYKNNDLLFSYVENGSISYQNIPANNEDFSVNIAFLDSLSVEGTFEGKIKDASGNAKTIVNGKFHAEFTARRNQSPGAGNGQLIFWSRQGCGSGGTGQIKVLAGNKEGFITNFQSAEPDCSATGVASFTLPVGSYECDAICGQDTVRMSVTVIEGICTKAEVGFCNFLQTGCIISEDTLFFPPTLTLESKKYTFNAQRQVERMERINLRNGEILLDLRISYSGSQIVINQDGVFGLDGCGRIREYVGYDIPGNYQNGKKLYLRFYYNASGYMEKITYADANAPGLVNEELTLDWTSGNLTSGSYRDLNSLAHTEYEWRYDFSKEPRNFICIIPSNPILYLQSALNYGKNPVNLIDHLVTKATDKSGQLAVDTTYFGGYVQDANNYIREFNVSGKATPYYERGSHFLAYRCF